MGDRTDPRVVDWVNTETEKLAERGFFPGSPREDEMLAFWRRYRPKMCARARAVGPDFLERMAFVLDEMRYEAKKKYIKSGMPPTDAEMEAAKDWLLMEPEDETPPPRHRSVPISTLKILSDL